MRAYIDSSVILRVVFGEDHRLAEWGAIEHGITSELARVECLRTVDRIRLQLGLDDDEMVLRNEAVFEILRHMDLVLVSTPVLQRASQPFPTTLGTLDAIHLSSALLWQQRNGGDLTFLTHDQDLGKGARSVGLPVLGCG